MSDHRTCNDAEFVRRFEGYELFPLLVRLLALGRPLTVDDLASATCRPARAIEGLLRSQPGVEWDEDGRLVGAGLSLRPTEHRYTVGGRSLYTWCAADTILFTVILGEPAVAESRCPATGRMIRVELSPDAVVSVDPAEAVVSKRQPAGEVCDIRGDICNHGHFFASRAAARDWLDQHPDGSVLTVAEASESARATCQTLGWIPPGSDR